MYEILIVIHALVTFALIGIILMQKNSGDGGGLATNSSSGSFLSGRSAATLVTRTTAILAGIFIALSLLIGIVTAKSGANGSASIMDKMEAKKIETPVMKKEEPAKPAVPRPQ